MKGLHGLAALATSQLHCCYCDCELTGENYSREHLVPRSKGGNGTRENLKPCCRQCNGERGNQPLVHWLERLRLRQLGGKGNRKKRDRIDQQIASIEHWLHYIEQQGRALFVDREKYLRYKRNYSLNLY